MQNLHWIQEGTRYRLKNGDELMVELMQPLVGNATFFINGNKYYIYCKGYWKPRYEVILDGIKILEFSFNFWKSSGNIIYMDGHEYKTDYQSKNGLKLRFLDNENEILVFGIDNLEKKRIGITFYLGIVMEDAEKILILSALGMAIFSSQVNELIVGGDLLSIIV